MASDSQIPCAYAVMHSRVIDDDVDRKFIGVFGSEEDARAGIHSLSAVEGFRDYPEGFAILEFEVDSPSAGSRKV